MIILKKKREKKEKEGRIKTLPFDFLFENLHLESKILLTGHTFSLF